MSYKIIKEGKVLKFDCENCGCEFETKRYSEEKTQYNTYKESRCPECVERVSGHFKKIDN